MQICLGLLVVREEKIAAFDAENPLSPAYFIAGSKEKQYQVDFTFNLHFAQKAKTNGIENYVLVSSVGANPKSNIFYASIKGELDEAVTKLGFKNLAVLRPSSLTGDREETRWMEKMSIPIVRFVTQFIFKKY